MFNKARKIWRFAVENPFNDIERVQPGPAWDRFLSTQVARLLINEAKKHKMKNFILLCFSWRIQQWDLEWQPDCILILLICKNGRSSSSRLNLEVFMAAIEKGRKQHPSYRSSRYQTHRSITFTDGGSRYKSYCRYIGAVNFANGNEAHTYRRQPSTIYHVKISYL